ncbi:DUF4179 domain-containing protein [Paenibacillus thiaminolyticus]|uniref:DUF4179 domain-containing protein n=1 Tax=Paenibacillus thiaminolyticus TaxID=49283 RepID=A0AAP9DW36_PANTH|nr:DUF4179 domain-containing protein [Paenibacillus thiaminolyticus]MCY9534315.1 DUF4179 domain-containing protein [Paenibacillus thiaminolyticus]MCY9603026.1 DUF4179 domain-containing protein [Paenibacillus thiaminolyticus]MCY9608257.1 DUF4179 domain-containing protein [Paenibacillus thiaminolyticus]MCY9611625.1 DUF4179 domain-containing protein [Paenibacillus thiaminolyticus]MCY9618247.1 DUF4179 domain-containing protein [Paenibacillus thiaminolyticus]
MSRHQRIVEEIEKIELPEELHQYSKLGIDRAKRELAPSSRTRKAAKAAAATAAGLLLAAAIGAAISPTFAEVMKSWFSLQKADGGLKQAADDGYAESVNKQVTDQGITLRVKEAIHDVFRISILFGLEQDGRPLNSDLLFETFIPEGTDDDPYVNRYEIIDDEGKVLPLSPQLVKSENDRILTLGLDDLVPGHEVQSLSDLPDRITVRFDINQIGKTRGKWHLEVPIDLSAAKASSNLVPLSQRYISPLGFSIDFKQLRHSPSKSELLLQVDETQAWRSEKKIEPMFRYEIKDGEGNIVAAMDGLRRGEVSIGSRNVLKRFLNGQGSIGHMKYRHAFLPFPDAKELTLELTAIYTEERADKELAVAIEPEALRKKPLLKEVNGKSVTFKMRVKEDEAPEQMKDGRSVLAGKGWILEADQQLGSDTLDLQWRMEDGQGKPVQAQSVTELEQDEQGNYRNRTLFFFEGQTPVYDRLTMYVDSWTKKIPVNWSIPLVPSSEELTPLDEVPIYEMTVDELKPGMVRQAEQALRELAPGMEAELYGAAEYSDRWFLYAKDNSRSIVIVEKATMKPIAVQRSISYGELDEKLRKTVEDILRQLSPDQPVVFEEAVREKSEVNNRWVLHNEHADIIINALTGKLMEASLSYEPGRFDAEAKAVADTAYSSFAQGRALEMTRMVQRVTPTRHVWEFYRDMSLLAAVDVKTNQVRSVEQSFKNDHPGDDIGASKKYAEPRYTAEQAIAKASPAVKEVFGINLEGYEVSIRLNEYTFTRQGAATVRGTVNAKGEFWKLEQMPAEDSRQ